MQNRVKLAIVGLSSALAVTLAALAIVSLRPEAAATQPSGPAVAEAPASAEPAVAAAPSSASPAPVVVGGDVCLLYTSDAADE